MWEISWCFFYCLPWGKGKYWKARRMTNGLVLTCFLVHWSNEEKLHLSSPIKKIFINYIFCRNWAVRNPAGTRLDSSSLVNKQVGPSRVSDSPVSGENIICKACFLMGEIGCCFSLNCFQWGLGNIEKHLFVFSIEAMQKNSILVLPSKQRLQNLCFLQKLGCQKPCWDQARLSSLVNKQVGVQFAVS